MRLFRGLLFLAAMVLACGAIANSAMAANKTFLEALSPAEKDTAGLNHLNPDQQATLDNLVEREVILAQQGGVTGFAAEFTKRRSAPELAKMGLEKLTDQQRSYVNVLVARRIATQSSLSIPAQSLAAQSYSSKAPIAVAPLKPSWETHGTISFTAGTAGGGRNFYGGGVEVDEVNPSLGLEISVAYSELHGKGLSPWCTLGGRPAWW